jgi:3-phosphoshikimate 1-carboxyvinyltransferase
VNVSLHFSNKSKKNKIIDLVSSKSESNRVLIIQSLCKEKFEIKNLSFAEDTILLQSLIEINNGEINCKHGGTTFRFLTAYFACTNSNVILTGSKRMKERPIKVLVDALISMGANISYLENEGYPPIQIRGKKLKGKDVTIDSSVSSQYISALLLIAPTLENGLKIKLYRDMVSKPYIEMTLKIMNYFGIEYSYANNKILIEQQNYTAKKYTIENDWSAASYWYSIASMLDDCKIKLPALKKNSLQGDAILAKLFEQFGVKTSFYKNYITLCRLRNYVPPNHFQFDFKNCPDLAQTIAVTCAALNISAQLNGLETLSIKESNRIEAVCKELEKTGAILNQSNNSISVLKGCNFDIKNIFIHTYNDHRMAMAFAPLVIKYKNIKIENDEVVKKSYPNFWNDLKQFGINVY